MSILNYPKPKFKVGDRVYYGFLNRSINDTTYGEGTITKVIEFYVPKYKVSWDEIGSETTYDEDELRAFKEPNDILKEML
jgi:hypothetical protein